MSSLFEDVVHLFKGLGVISAIGVIAAISVIHIIGMQSAVRPLGPFLATPTNAAYIIGNLVYAYAWALMFGLVWQISANLAFELYEGIRARIKGSLRRVRVDERDDFQYFFSRLQNQLILAVVFYAWMAWLFATMFAILLFLTNWAWKKLGVQLPKFFPEYFRLSDISSAVAHDERMLRSAFLGMILLAAYALGSLRVMSVSGDHLVIVSSNKGEVSGSLILRLSDGLILETDSRKFIYVGNDGLIVEGLSGKSSKDSNSESSVEIRVDHEE